MTFRGEATPATTRTMKILVLVMIAWVAYWAATGGLDQIVVPEEDSATTLLGRIL